MSAAPRDGSEAPQPAAPAPSRTRRRRPLPAPSAYRGTPPPANKVELPPGHGAQIFPLPTATGFVGGEFSMDSLEFLRWAALRYDSDRFVLVVLMTLIGSQEPGGLIEATQEQVAEYLGYTRSYIVRVFNVLVDDGVLKKVRRGVYALNPAAALRGGFRKPTNTPTGKKATAKAKGERVEQLDLLRTILEDPDAPEAWREMAMPGAKLVTRPKPGSKDTEEGATE